jgi:hypothetical protein
MNKKQLALIIGLGVVLALIATSVVKKQASPYVETAKEGVKLLGDFDLNAVAGLTIKSGTNVLNLTKKGDLWVVQQRHDYPANFSSISDLIKKFWELKVARPLKVGPSRLPALQLAGPDKGSTLVDMNDASGKLIRAVTLGAKSMKEGRDEGQFGGGGWPNGRYVMVGNDLKTVALVADALTTAETNPETWLNKDFFKVEKLRSITVTPTNSTSPWTFARDTENGELKLADKKEGEDVDTSKASSLSSMFSYPSFNDVLPPDSKPEETGLDKPVVAKLETFDHFTYNVLVGKAVKEDNYAMRVSVSADLPKERTPGKDEKPEDKAKLDKEFKEKNDKLKEKLTQEKALEKWTYLVSKWTVESMLKDRTNWMAEKKAEPAKPAADASAVTNAIQAVTAAAAAVPAAPPLIETKPVEIPKPIVEEKPVPPAVIKPATNSVTPPPPPMPSPAAPKAAEKK